MTPRRAALIARVGERRIAERRIELQPDPMVALLNRITADRDRLKAENRALRAQLTGGLNAKTD